MKRAERHHLKENEVAEWVLSLKDYYDENQKAVHYGAVVVLLVAVAVFATMGWRATVARGGNTMLAAAMTIAESPITSPTGGSDGKLPVQPAGTFPSEKSRHEAALPKFLETANTYPDSESGIIARYRAAAAQVSLGQTEEGIQNYRIVIEKGTGVIQAMARLGMADAQLAAGKHDDAIQSLKGLAAAAGTDAPLDGVLMQLGRAYRLAGKAADAKASFQRVVDEFPLSIYAGEARRAIDAL